MATNSFSIDKIVKINDVFLIDAEIGGEVNDTNEFDLELPAGGTYRIASCMALVTTASANTATQVLLVKKVTAAGAVSTVCTYTGAAFQNKAAGVILADPTIDDAETDFEGGDSIRFSLAWGAADTGTARVTLMLSKR